MKLCLKSHEIVNSMKKTLSCHASTVLPLADGRVLAAWFGGSCERGDDVGIWLAEKDGLRFGESRVIDHTYEPHWNPVLFECADGRIELFFKVGKPIPDWRTMVATSTDGGRTFSEPRELVPGDRSGGRGPVRCKPLRLKSGRVLAPASVERGINRCFMDLSDDDCRTWRRSPLIEIEALKVFDQEYEDWMRRVAAGECGNECMPEAVRVGRGIIQPTLWEDDAGVHALMRSGEGFIYRSDSTDDGETWSQPHPIALANNNSGIDLARLPDGTLLLVCNPVSENFGARSPLSLYESKDGGETWTHLAHLETEPGEFSYPAIVYRDGLVHITYTWNRVNIAYWQFSVE